MKIDVEGHELQVLEGAAKTISQSRPWLLIEFNPSLAGTDRLGDWEVHELLIEHNYRAFLPQSWLTGASTEWLPASWSNRERYCNLLYFPNG